jgi:hypothetical protein
LENIMAASSQSRSGRRFWLLGGGIVLAIALYTGGWFYAASELKNTVLKAIAPGNAAGVTGECSNIDFRGYPFRIGLFCSKVDVDDNVNGVSATFGELRSAAQVYAPGHIVWELDSPAEIRTAHGLSINAEWTNLQSSLVTKFKGVDRTSTVIDGLKATAISSVTGQTINVDATQAKSICARTAPISTAQCRSWAPTSLSRIGRRSFQSSRRAPTSRLPARPA